MYIIYTSSQKTRNQKLNSYWVMNNIIKTNELLLNNIYYDIQTPCACNHDSIVEVFASCPKGQEYDFPAG